MKKKDDVVTRGILEEELKEKLIETKEQLREEMAIMRDYLDEKNRKYRDEILTRIDNFTNRVSILEDENEIGTDQTRELRIDVDNHEKRITKLETQTA